MDFMRLLKSLEELLYEFASWLVFYPVTFWRTVRTPSAMMRYADTELVDTERDRYSDTLSPPLFLLVTLLIAHGMEIALSRYAPVWSRPGLLSTESNLLIFRALAFSLFPLVMAVKLIRRKGARLDRDRLRPPFYSQCYVAGPFTLGVSAAGQIARIDGDVWAILGSFMFAAVVAWYVVVETRWFRKDLDISTLRAGGIVVVGIIEATTLVLVAGAFVIYDG